MGWTEEEIALCRASWTPLTPLLCKPCWLRLCGTLAEFAETLRAMAPVIEDCLRQISEWAAANGLVASHGGPPAASVHRQRVQQDREPWRRGGRPR